MRKSNFWVVSVNQYVLPVAFCLFTICLLVFSKQNLTAAKTRVASLGGFCVASAIAVFYSNRIA